MTRMVIGIPSKLASAKTIGKMPHRRLMDEIAIHWPDLIRSLISEYGCSTSYGGYTCEDVMIEAFEVIVRRDSLLEAKTDTILAAFRMEFRFLRVRAIKNEHLRYKLLHGLDKQTEEEED